MLMWILLPPIFLACGLLAFAAPLFFRERKVHHSRPKTAPAERVLANAN
jgi:hypothetical protein